MTSVSFGEYVFLILYRLRFDLPILFLLPPRKQTPEWTIPFNQSEPHSSRLGCDMQQPLSETAKRDWWEKTEEKKKKKKKEACIQNDVIIHSWWNAFFMALTKTCVFPATPLPSSPVLLTPKERKKRVRTVRGTHIINKIMSYLLIQHCHSRSFSRGPL